MNKKDKKMILFLLMISLIGLVIYMTVRERMIASRLIMKIDAQGSYAEQIGLSYEEKLAEKTVKEIKKEDKE